MPINAKSAIFVHFQFYPSNVVQPQCRGHSKMTLNIIFVLIIVTHAQGFGKIKNMGVKGTKQCPNIAKSMVRLKLKVICSCPCWPLAYSYRSGPNMTHSDPLHTTHLPLSIPNGLVVTVPKAQCSHNEKVVFIEYFSLFESLYPSFKM